jgi:5'-3' exonuclease
MQHLKFVSKQHEMSEDLIRHMCINTIRSNVKQFRSKYRNIILCCDSKHYWRRDYFPFYKSHRKHDREASGLDWDMIFTVLNGLRDELRDNFPYKTLNVEGAEADDVIAVLTARLAPHAPVLILSSDKDFGQLQKYPNVTQYSPILKRFIKIDDPLKFVREHIIKGDRGDGIPNFLTNDNAFAIGERQKPINSKKLTEWLQKDVSEFCTTDSMLRCYKRNQTLIDFDYIPNEIQSKIVEAFDEAKPATKEKMLNYFIDKNLKVMIESITDF